MTPRRRDPYSQKDLNPTPGTGEEHSRGTQAGNRELSMRRVALALHGASDPDEVCQIALTTLTDPQQFAYPIGMFFMRDAERGLLYARALAPEERVHKVQGDAFRALEMPLDLAAEYPLVKALKGRRYAEIPTEEEPLLRDFIAALTPSPGRLVLWPVPGVDAPAGLLVLGAPTRDARHESGDGAWIEMLLGHWGQALMRLEQDHHQRARLTAVDAVHGVVKEILSANSLADVLLQTARVGAHATGAGRAIAWTYDEANRELTLGAQYIVEGSDLLDATLPRFQQLAQRCAQQGGALLHRDLRSDSEMDLAAYPNPLSAITVPLIAFGEVCGVLAAIDRPSGKTSSFAQADEDLLCYLAALAAVSVKNVRLADGLKEVRKQLRENQRMLVETERLASIGELTARVAKEIRKPLSGISGLAKRMVRHLPKGDAVREDAELICTEAQRLEDLVVQQIQAAEHPAPRMAMRQITQLIHETVVLVREELMGRGVFLEENYADRVPELLLDGPRLKQALLNILHDSLESVQDGDTIRIEVLREGDRVLLEIANTGRPAAGEIVDKLFVPFQTSGPAGIGLGLSAAQQIIREHGGEVSVRSEGEWGAIFTISLPIRANQERRKLQDRRIARDRRKPKKGRGKDAA